eukprot:3289986-Amphidinium_carterae.1
MEKTLYPRKIMQNTTFTNRACVLLVSTQALQAGTQLVASAPPDDRSAAIGIELALCQCDASCCNMETSLQLEQCKLIGAKHLLVFPTANL